ncbi:MAG: hypothetical protein Q7S29_00460 [Candidatus Peribacter sp.]|nr:hypothetical protein [Candidatus Peribacter sp.]
MTDSNPQSRGVLHSGWGPLLWALLFVAVYAAAYFLQKPSALVVSNAQLKDIFDTYGIAVGPALALVGLIVMYIVALLKRIVGLRRFKILNPLVVLAVALPALAFGYQLAYREKPYTDIARGIIGSLAMPFLIASAVVSALAVVWFLLILIRRR